jgi:serine/threonine protein kinase
MGVSYHTPHPLPTWYSSRSGSAQGYDLLCKLFEWDPARRITAREALAHPWFKEEGGVNFKWVPFSLMCMVNDDMPRGGSLSHVLKAHPDCRVGRTGELR